MRQHNPHRLTRSGRSPIAITTETSTGGLLLVIENIICAISHDHGRLIGPRRIRMPNSLESRSIDRCFNSRGRHIAGIIVLRATSPVFG